MFIEKLLEDLEDKSSYEIIKSYTKAEYEKITSGLSKEDKEKIEKRLKNAQMTFSALRKACKADGLKIMVLDGVLKIPTF